MINLNLQSFLIISSVTLFIGSAFWAAAVIKIRYDIKERIHYYKMMGDMSSANVLRKMLRDLGL